MSKRAESIGSPTTLRCLAVAAVIGNALAAAGAVTARVAVAVAVVVAVA